MRYFYGVIRGVSGRILFGFLGAKIRADFNRFLYIYDDFRKKTDKR